MNIFDLPPLPLPGELTTILAENETVRIERIVSTGQTTDWYDQSESEFVLLLQGSATLEFDDGEAVKLIAGDTVAIPPHKRHRVAFTSTLPPCVWLCVLEVSLICLFEQRKPKKSPFLLTGFSKCCIIDSIRKTACLQNGDFLQCL